jgi:catechol 2,3-dioxygenase-like lactoylglutathione lyase family enzyme
MSHVSFPVRDLARALAFYRDLLGFAEIPRPAFGVPGAWLRAGDADVHLIAGVEGMPLGAPPPVLNPAAHHVAFRIDDYQPVGLGHLRGDLREVLGARHADRDREPELRPHAASAHRRARDRARPSARRTRLASRQPARQYPRRPLLSLREGVVTDPSLSLAGRAIRLPRTVCSTATVTRTTWRGITCIPMRPGACRRRICRG